MLPHPSAARSGAGSGNGRFGLRFGLAVFASALAVRSGTNIKRRKDDARDAATAEEWSRYQAEQAKRDEPCGNSVEAVDGKLSAADIARERGGFMDLTVSPE